MTSGPRYSQSKDVKAAGIPKGAGAKGVVLGAPVSLRSSVAPPIPATSRDPVIDWQTAQDYGLFSMAADLIRDHVAYLQNGAPAAVIRLDDHRKTRA